MHECDRGIKTGLASKVQTDCAGKNSAAFASGRLDVVSMQCVRCWEPLRNVD